MQPKGMDERTLRLVRPGLPQSGDPRKPAIMLILLMVLSISHPVAADTTISRDDFDVLDALMETLSMRTENGEALIAQNSAEASLAQVDANARTLSPEDPLAISNSFLDGVTMRDSTSFEPDHPRPYEFLMDASTQPDGFPNNLFDTLFSVNNLGLDNILAIGVNTYAVYVNFTSRDNGPSYEAWEQGTFTGELIVNGQILLFTNLIDIDGDGADDLSVALTIEGIFNRGEGWDVETSGGIIPIVQKLWINPTFQWKVSAIDQTDPLWDSLQNLEISLMKGLAFDITLDESESYAIVIDTRFTQPPHEFTLGVGIEKIEFNVAPQDLVTFLASLVLGGINSSQFSLTSITAPYSVQINNPNAPGSNLQTNCQDENYYDPIADNEAPSHEHKCGYGIGVGFIRFDGDGGGEAAPILEMSYLDAGFHPEMGDTRLPEEVDITIRNDNLGENSFDSVEIYSDKGSDVYLHYFEDRENVPEGDSSFGNVTDARVWIHGLPSGTMPQEEINSIFTMIGEAPGSVNLPGEVPARLSLIIAIKNFSGDNTQNVDDPTLPVNPIKELAPNTLIAIVGSESIDRLEYKSTFERGGVTTDRSSLEFTIEDIPEVVLVEGSFLIAPTGIDRVNYDNPNLNSIAQIFDNALLSVVQVALDIGDIVNSLPDLIVSTTGSDGGKLHIHCYDQVKGNIAGDPRETAEIGLVELAFSSSDNPVITGQDHILIAEDTNIDLVIGRDGQPIKPLVPVAISIRVTGISSVIQEFDPDTDVRELEITGTSGEPILIGHIKHQDGDQSTATTQSARISNRPDTLKIIQTSNDVTYQASGAIQSITYGGKSPSQQNAIQLNGLPDEFTLTLGDTLGYTGREAIDSIIIQLSNATEARTMDGDHFRFFVNQDTSEASLSLKISDIISLKRYSPQVPDAVGPEGNSIIEMVRSQSSPFYVLLEDESQYDDEFLGMNGRVMLDPLPSNISLAFPSTVDSSGLELPSFDEGEGIESLSFFLGDLVDFGSSVNDLIYDFTKDLVGTEGDEEDFSLGVDLLTGEAFNLTVDVRKGNNGLDEPIWSHGIGMNAKEASVLNFNLSRLPSLTQSDIQSANEILDDYKIDKTEEGLALDILTRSDITQADMLISVLEDGTIYDFERNLLNETLLEEQGITFEFRRSWHNRLWLPQLPAGEISLEYDFRMIGDIPQYEFELFLGQWKPLREQISIVINGLQGTDMDLVIDGLDTTKPNDVSANAVFFTQDDLIVPRFNVIMTYDFGSNLDSVHATFIDRIEDTRVEALIIDVAQSMEFSATIGDIFNISMNVPEQFRTQGKFSAEKLMIQQMRYIDGFWWPATTFMRNLPSVMSLSAIPANDFDIRKDTSFQGMMTLDYSSNGDDLDLYLEASGRAVDFRGDVLMIAQGLPSTFKLETTSDWGMRVASSGEGVESLYMKQTNIPVQPGVMVNRLELVGEDLKSATIKVKRGPYEYPVIILEDITSGRIVASSQVTSQPGYYVDFFGDTKFDGRAVMLDTQFTGIIPVSSSLGVNGMVSDLSLIGTLTGGNVETRHVLLVEPVTSLIASTIAMLG
jgi:hypothetical protein